MSKTQANTEVLIPAIEKTTVTLKLVGDSPLIVHKWSEKAKKEMLDKQMGKAKKTKEFKDPWMDYCSSMYWLTPMPENPTQEDINKAKFGFPTSALKACAASGGYRSKVTKDKVSIYSAFFIHSEFFEIIGAPNIREDMVVIAGGTADIRYRGEFKNWSTLIDVTYNRNSISAEQIVNLLNLGGFGVGIGEWRTEKGGSFGSFHVE